MSVWSNIAYVIAGLLLWETPFISMSMIALGITSALAHAKGGWYWKLDWASMWLVFSAIALHPFGLSYLAVIFALIGYKYGVDNYIAFSFVWALSVLSAHLSGVPVLFPVTIFAVALVSQLYAESEYGTKTYEIYHSIWHVLTAIAIYLLV
jgi:hypothetical protein